MEGEELLAEPDVSTTHAGDMSTVGKSKPGDGACRRGDLHPDLF